MSKSAKNNNNRPAESIDDSSDEYFGPNNDEIGLKNRPKLLRDLLQQYEIKTANKQRSSKQQAANSLLKNKQAYEHLFRLEFDPSSGIPETWVETKTLNWLNTQRENIYASSSQFDLIYLQNLQDVKEKNLKLQKQQNSGKAGQLTQSQKSNQPNNNKLINQIDVKESVALQRGKRSCTLADIKKNMNQQKLSTQSKQESATSGRRSVESLLDQAKILTEGNQPLGITVKNNSAANDAYDFCHYCKQLKNKFLLISCKYSSKNTAPIISKGNQQQNQVINYVQYPYEPQVYPVKDIKIYNLDLQNKAQIRGFMERTRKDLKQRNMALVTAQNALRQQMELEGCDSIFAPAEVGGDLDISNLSINKQSSGANMDSNGKRMVKSEMIPLPSHQLMSWLQDLNINPYTLDPYDVTQFSTDLKTIYPNFYKQLYQGYSSTPSPCTSRSSHKKVVDYECKRKFCTFCLQTNFDESLNDIVRNKNWHCHHCTGYCYCTRCQRQEITTQLKGYLISLGGNLNVLKSHSQKLNGVYPQYGHDIGEESMSLFDQIILKQFNEHLEITLAYNQSLYEKYPYYARMIRSLPYDEPDQDVLEDEETREQIEWARGDHLDDDKDVSKFYVQKSAVGMDRDTLKLGFTGSEEEPARDIRKNLNNNNITEASLKNNNYGANGIVRPGDVATEKEYEKLALSMLFKYSMYNKKVDDLAGGAGSAFNALASKPEEALSDKKFQEQLIRSIRTHDPQIINRIQKRRGRKKFILGQEDATVTQTFSGLKSLFNRREQKYLDKVAAMRDNPLQSTDVAKIQPLINGEMNDYKENWPRSNQKCLTTLQKLLSQFDLPRPVDLDSSKDESVCLKRTTSKIKKQSGQKKRKARKMSQKVR